jgi:uncharacterized protein YukE
MSNPGEFEIDPDVLRSASEAMQRYTDEFARSVQTLSARTTGAGSPWGADEMGSLFGMAYTEASQLGFQALSHLADVLGGMAEALGKVGEVIEAADKGQGQTFDQAGAKAPG